MTRQAVRRRIAELAAAFAVILVPLGAARAQKVMGAVHDSASHRPVAGAVVILTSASGTTLARTITNGEGRFAFDSGASGTAVHVLHIGFRPGNVELSAATTTTVRTADVSLARLADMMDTMYVVANNRCPGRSGSAAPAALLEQMREGVLATAVAAESKPADMVRLTYVRDFDKDGKISSQQVRRVANRSVDSFRAVYTAAQFVQQGFQQDSAGYFVFFAPDARTIVDPSFASGYCFQLTSDRHRPLEVGLEFSPRSRSDDRVDIEGTLWADTAKRELRDIEFEYDGVDPAMHRVHPGGRIGFRALPNGVVLVDEWSLRLPVVRTDSVWGLSGHAEARRVFAPQETGGRVVVGRWPDYVWAAPMGTLKANVRDSQGAPEPGAAVRLAGTDYEARSDSTGSATIEELLPGPYALSVEDSAFTDFARDTTTVLRFVAVADSVIHEDVAATRPLEAVVAAFCPNRVRPGKSSIIVGRFHGVGTRPGDSAAVATAAWGPATPGSGSDSLQVQATANASGLFAFCGLPAATTIVLEGSQGSGRARRMMFTTPATRELLRHDLYLEPATTESPRESRRVQPASQSIRRADEPSDTPA